MQQRKQLTFAFMDPPFESERTVSFFRLLDAALDKDADVCVFAYEGAAALAFTKQAQHGNAVHGHDLQQEDHPLTKIWIKALQDKARFKGLRFEWVNCGLCVDERGVNESIDDCQRGGPSDFWSFAENAFNSLTIGTR